MNKHALCVVALAVGCAESSDETLVVDVSESGISGSFDAGERTVKFETVRIGDKVAARFSTEKGDPIAIAVDETAVPPGWALEELDDAATIDPKEYAVAIEGAIDALRGREIAAVDVEALARVAEVSDLDGAQKNSEQAAWGFRAWYTGCYPTRYGGEEAWMHLINYGPSGKTAFITKSYGTRSGFLYHISYNAYVPVYPNGSHRISLYVSNGANITSFSWQADPVDWLYRGAYSDRCW